MTSFYRWFLSSAVVLGGGLICAGGAYGGVTQVATLSPASGQGLLMGIAASGSALVGGVPGSGFIAGQGVLDVFTASGVGWISASPAAQLVDPTAVHGPFAPSISGVTVVANYGPAMGASFDDVFVESPGGWSSSVLPAARLVGPDGDSLDGGVISGNTIVAFARSPQGVISSLCVFVEPAGGWSGVVLPAATLVDSTGLALSGPPVISAGTVFAAAQSVAPPGEDRAVRTVDVFAEPASGWAGTVHQVARLADITGYPAPAAVSGDVLTAGLSLFRQPASGWHGTVRPFAGLFPADPRVTPTVGAFSGGVAAASGDSPGSGHECPCSAQVWLFTEPGRGWVGTVAAPPALSATTQTGNLNLALEGGHLFTSGGTSVQVYNVTRAVGHEVGPPSVTRASASGLISGRAQLSFDMAVGPDDPLLTSFTLNLPNGLAFARQDTRSANAISISIPGTRGYSLALQRRILSARLKAPAVTLQVTIGPEALSESQSLRKLLIGRAHRKPPLALRAIVHGTDTNGDATISHIRFVVTR
jgi:hypothetical protein